MKTKYEVTYNLLANNAVGHEVIEADSMDEAIKELPYIVKSSYQITQVRNLEVYK